MNIAVLVKQVNTDAGPEMDALSRRAAAQGAELAAAVGDGTVTAISLGPTSAEDVLRETIAWGRACSVMTEGVLVTSDAANHATPAAAAGILAATLASLEPFDVVLLGGRSSDDATGLLGTNLAPLLGMPFAAWARYLSVQARRLHVRCEHEDEWVQLTVEMPAVVSCAADLIQPCGASPTARALVPAELIRTVAADQLATPTIAPTVDTHALRVVSRTPREPG
ncbi:MAG: hypothetical protein FJW86_09100 [Actinobacteria bacterium]|nr:hypothetical protein [Actinomycetota bacterium]